MGKIIVAGILGVILGLVGGAAAMHLRLMPQVVSMEQNLLQQEQALAASRAEQGGTARLARLETERETYEESLNKLRSEIEALRQRPTATVTPADTSNADSLEEEAAVNATAVEDGTSGERGRRGGGWDGGGTPEERDARRQEFVSRMQENLTGFFTGELEKSSDPATQERLVALETQVQDMMALRGQMRDASTDEEREALDQSFRAAMESAQDTMKEQRRAIVDAMASQFNITNSADRKAFQQAVSAAVESPFFSDNPMALLYGGGSFGGGGTRGSRGPGGRR